MNTGNTSPYLGYITINPNKEYYCTEYFVKDDDFLGRLTIQLDRPANIYIFPTRYDELTGLYVSKGSSIFKQTDYDYAFETMLSEKMNTKFIIIFEYDAMKLGVVAPLVSQINFKKSTLGEIYKSDFYMFETRSGIPYPAHDIGTYSRYEFDIQQTQPAMSYKRTGMLYNVTTGVDDTVTSANIKLHCSNLVQGIMGYNHRQVVLEDFPVVSSGSTLLTAIQNNAQLIADKITQNKIILLAEEASTRVTTEFEYMTILKKIMDEPIYNNVLLLVDELMDIAYDFTATLIRYAEQIEALIIDTTLSSKVFTFINDLYSSTITADSLTNSAQNLELIKNIECITISKTNGELTTTKYLSEMMSAPVVSGRIDLQGHSSHTGKYASSKILVGHFHENERGYLKHTLATDRYGKTHKDPFVKNKELWGKEEDYIYLDLLHSTKNIFSNSNKIMRGVALLTDKQFKDPPKGTITFKFLDLDEYQANGSVISVIPDVIFSDTYSAIYRAQKIIELEQNNETLIYVLTNKTDFMKMFIRQEGIDEEYIFWYSQRIATYTYSFVDENGVNIQNDFIVVNKATHAYEAPLYIYSPPRDVDVPTYERMYYKLVSPKGMQYSAARWKNDSFHIVFNYELVTASFVFNLIDKDTQKLIPISDDTIITFKDIDPVTETLLNTTYDVSGIDLEPPEDKNPIEFTKLAKLTYNAPFYITIDNLHKYKLMGAGFFKNLLADELNPVIIYDVEYELVRSKFIYNFLDDQDNSLMDRIEFDANIQASYTAPLIIHTNTMADDEYYTLEAKPTFIESYPSYVNFDDYPTVKLAADETQSTIIFNFRYKRLLGSIKINYFSTEGGFLDIIGYNQTQEFINVASVSTKTTGTSHLTGINPTIVIPITIESNRNKKFELDTVSTVSEQKLIITPTQLEIIHNLYYNPIRTNPEVIYTLATNCEQRTYTKYLLLDENDTILGKFDLSVPTFDFSGYGLNVHLVKTVTRGGSEVPLSTVMPIDIAPGIEILEGNETPEHAQDYSVRLEGKFTFDISQLSNKTLRLVGFINIPGSGQSGLHGSGHDIFSLRYANPILNSTYGSYVPSQFPRQAINFTSTILDVGRKYDVVGTGGIMRARVFLTIDLSKEMDEEVFFIHDSIASGSSTFTVSL